MSMRTSETPRLQPIVNVAEMVAAEQVLFDGGISVEALMQRAGEGAGELIWRIGGKASTLVVCGPGNNGGDGYVIAEHLRRKGVPVVVAQAAEPRTLAAQAACSAYQGVIMPLESAQPQQQFVDCMFGSGLTRAVEDDLWIPFRRLHEAGERRIAIDLPSGVDADRALPLNPVLRYDHCIALGAWKYAHMLEPAASSMATLSLVDIGADVKAPSAQRLGKPHIIAPASDDHKYTRGLVVVIAGEMPGAAILASQAAQGAGAGYVKIAALTPAPAGLAPYIVWHHARDEAALAKFLGDPRIAVCVIGPGLGRGETSARLLSIALARGGPLVIDADAIHLLAERPENLALLRGGVLLTPHQGECASLERAMALDELAPLNKVVRAQRLSDQLGCSLILKGRDSVLCASGSPALVADRASPWLSVAGSGDVLSGAVAARLAARRHAGVAMAEAQWLHGRAAQLSGTSFSALKLAHHLSSALEECL